MRIVNSLSFYKSVMKRVVDTARWDEQWFVELSPVHKCLWRYINDKCDYAGIWNGNFMLASFCIGQQITESDLLVFGDRVKKINDSTYFIQSFITEQYGRLSDKSRPHVSIKHRLEQIGISVSGEKKQPKKTNPVKVPAQTEQVIYFDDVMLNNAFVAFLNERKAWKKPATEHAVKLLIKKLNRLSGGNISLAIQIIEKSITSRWTDFYPLSDKSLKVNQLNEQTISKFING